MSGPSKRPTTCRTVAGLSMAAPEFLRAEANEGFDRDANPPWQMIPTLGVRTVHLKGGGADLSDFSFQSQPADLVSIESVPFDPRGDLKRSIILVGRKAGNGYVLATLRTNPTCTVRLAIAVKTQKLVNVYFQFVANDADPSKPGKTGPSSTQRTMDEIEDILKEANAILTPQTNIKLQDFGRTRLLLKEEEDSTDPLSKAQPGVRPKLDERDRLFRHANHGADFNVFFVRSMQSQGKGSDKGVRTAMSQRKTMGATTSVYVANCILEDRLGAYNSTDPKTTGRVLAHEIGQYLLFRGTIDSDDQQYHGQNRPNTHLMNNKTKCLGTFIPKDDANRMNRS